LTEVVEGLPSKHKVLSSNPSTGEKKKEGFNNSGNVEARKDYFFLYA
jgi:hypothetical protein